MCVMKFYFRALFFAFLLAGSTPFAANCFAQTSIYKAPVSGPSAGTQRVALTYRASFDIPTPVSGEVLVTVPFPVDDEVQRVEKYSFGSAMSPEKLLSVSFEREAVYGNRYLEIKVLNPAPGDELVFEYEISRKEKSNPLDIPISANAKILTPEKKFVTSLSAAKLSGELAKSARKVATPEMTLDQQITAIYRSLVSREDAGQNGANNAATMARAIKIPIKFESGVLIPFGKQEGEISGPHQWVELFHPQRGWIPVDVANGAIQKRYTDYYLGNIGSDHITFGISDFSQLEPSAFGVLGIDSNRSNFPVVPMEMKISFQRLPNLNPMIAPDQSSGVE